MDSWTGDACGLVAAFRARELSPVEATQACLDAVAASGLNAVCHVDAEAALAAAGAADVDLPFGGVPIAVKELEPVLGWPAAYGSLLLAGTTWPYEAVSVQRLRAGGAVPLVQTTASEGGLVAYTATKVHGTTGNPWDPTLTPGGSSGGTAAAVAAGLVPIGSGTDGGGSIRIPAAYCGLVGLKTSFRLIPMAPKAPIEPLTQTTGCLSRSVRDTARWLDVAAGAHPRDPFSLPSGGGWEAGLGSHDLAGLRVAILPDLGGAVVHPDVEAVVLAAAEQLLACTGMRRVDARLILPDMGPAWLAPALPVLWASAGAFWPEVRELVTDELALALDLARGYDINAAAQVDVVRSQVIEAMADLFEQVDLVLSATTPDDPHPAAGPSPVDVGGRVVEAWNTGRLTMPMNLSGLPALTVPCGLSPRGLPVGLQIIAPRHRDALLLDVAARWETERPWPLTAPTRHTR